MRTAGGPSGRRGPSALLRRGAQGRCSRLRRRRGPARERRATRLRRAGAGATRRRRGGARRGISPARGARWGRGGGGAPAEPPGAPARTGPPRRTRSSQCAAPETNPPVHAGAASVGARARRRRPVPVRQARERCRLRCPSGRPRASDDTGAGAGRPGGRKDLYPVPDPTATFGRRAHLYGKELAERPAACAGVRPRPGRRARHALRRAWGDLSASWTARVGFHGPHDRQGS